MRRIFTITFCIILSVICLKGQIMISDGMEDIEFQLPVGYKRVLYRNSFPGKSKQVDISGKLGYIFDGDVHPMSTLLPTYKEGFTPSIEMVQQAEAILADSLMQNAKTKLKYVPKVFANIDGFIRQYLGIVIFGKPVLLINFLPDNSISRQVAEKAIIMPKSVNCFRNEDRGKYGFAIIIDVTANRIGSYIFGQYEGI